jgi:hypothetical protein
LENGTDVAEFSESSLSIDLTRIGAICEEEWQAFLSDMDASPVPQKQDLRGFFLNWVAVFIPEAFPAPLQAKMSAWMAVQIDNSEAMNWSYVKPPLIGSTLFALTGNRWWLHIQLSNFADGGSLVRSFFHKSFALIAPRISFDEELVKRLDFGMKHAYFYMDVPLALYAVSQGDPEEKLVNLKRWQEGFMNTDEKNAVDGFVKGLPVINPLQYWMLEKTTYVAVRLGSFPVVSSSNSGLPLGIDFSAVWERVQEHPLCSASITLERAASAPTAT